MNWRRKGAYGFVTTLSESHLVVKTKGRPWNPRGQPGGRMPPESTQLGPQDLGGAQRGPSEVDEGIGWEGVIPSVGVGRCVMDVRTSIQE